MAKLTDADRRAAKRIMAIIEVDQYGYPINCEPEIAEIIADEMEYERSKRHVEVVAAVEKIADICRGVTGESTSLP